MKKGDIVTLAEIQKWKNQQFKYVFNGKRFNEIDGRAWWRKAKKHIANTAKFKVIELPNLEE